GGSELSSSPSGPATPRKSGRQQNGGGQLGGGGAGDSLLMPAAATGAGNIDEREFRRDEIPGGHETFSRTLKSQSGLRNDGTHFSEAKQEVNVRRETSERKI
uniref:Uncharacterized protein n=1 Tax=Romanomermis culicivorax TaxID=13658 RepID=A0A915KZ19_ROMCU